jgi:Ser/Thr protein kinase RdoA (MazF antagonist)
MDKQAIARIAKCYGINFRDQLTVSKGYRNESHPLLTFGGQIVNIIIYKQEPSIVHTIRCANRTSNFLAEQGYPARRTLDPRILRIQVGSWCRHAVLYNYLPGRTIAWEAYTKKHIKLLGGMLGNMHSELRRLPVSGYLAVTDQYTNHIKTIRAYINNKGVASAMKHKLGLGFDDNELKNALMLLAACRRLKRQQVLHLDFVRSNILFTSLPQADSSKDLIISGVLDFEKTAYGHPLFDIARSLAFLMVDCKHKSEQQVRKYFLFSGYQKRGNNRLPKVRLTGISKTSDLLARLVDIFLLYDFYKFLRHNPYQSLSDNEHFLRTRDLLLSRELIYRANDTIKLN